jgi:outer membrane protein OmpA-like peptidoglycan-associated protein
MRKYFTYLSLFFTIAVSAQSTNISTAFMGNIKKADHYFNRYAYRNALTLYQYAYDKDPSNVYIQEQIAECYFKINNPVEAEQWYRRIIDKPNLHHETKFEFAEVLSLNGKYEESKKWFDAYLNEHPDKKIAKDKADFLDKIAYYLLDSLAFTVTPSSFNSSHADYGPQFFHEGIVFASSRDLELFLKNKPMDGFDAEESLLNMYYVPGKVHGTHGQPQHLHKEHLGSPLHEGPMTFFNHETKTAFTRTNLLNGKPIYDSNGKAQLQIYFADIDKLNTVTNIQPFKFNDRSYSVAHPTLSPDGKIMYFSSTSPQGHGGSDIYVTRFENGDWTVPQNLGSNINSAGDESFPFLANDSTLYFASNGHGSMGGLDILVSYKRGKGFSKPINFGGPLNTRFDDFSFMSDSTGRAGYFASNRPGGKGFDDIYAYSVSNFFLKGVVESMDSLMLKMPGVKLLARYKYTGHIIDSTITDNKGLFALKLPFDQEFEIIAQKPGYEMNHELKISTRGLTLGVDSVEIIMLKKDLLVTGKIYSKETESGLEGVTINVLNLSDNLNEKIELGSTALYNLKLNRNRSFRVEFSKPGFITKSIDITTQDVNPKEYRKDIVLEEEFISAVTIHFDYKKSNLTKNAIELLYPVADLMKTRPELKLQILAHADSRGGKEYNMKLSEMRASSAVKYLVNKGINPARITTKAFGESMLLNDCYDDKPCKESEHAVNRRVELIIQH